MFTFSVIRSHTVASTDNHSPDKLGSCVSVIKKVVARKTIPNGTLAGIVVKSSPIILCQLKFLIFLKLDEVNATDTVALTARR